MSQPVRTMRRPSGQGADMLAPDARNSPHSHGDDQSRERRKSLFPPVQAGHRQSLKPGPTMSMAAKKNRMGAKGAVTDEREKSGYAPPANLEPTYRMEPHKRFYAPQVHTMLKQILEAHLDGFTYNPKFTPTMTKVLSDEIKERSKGLGFERYKLVVSVVLGERREQGLMISSRAAWDAKLDSYATYTFQNKSLFCTASVYGVYAE
ncbi:tctex1 domain-containing protein 2 [Aplysia californica]|uniref:Tctex1 domain-containing protein 2 n=1 Tax=Aplysia californica TaxID=6500 RepID=A0ABM0JQL9_APLCA|nr:tctex1 domain-containing protein 2 [Aplysia californica]